MSKNIRSVHQCRYCGGYIPDDDTASLLRKEKLTKYKKTVCSNCEKSQLEAVFEDFEDQPDPFGVRITTADDDEECSKHSCHEQAITRETWFGSLERAELRCTGCMSEMNKRAVREFAEIISDND